MRWDDRFALVLTLAAGLVLQGGAARAHDKVLYHQRNWSSSSVKWQSAITAAPYLAGLQAGANTWNNIGRQFTFVYDGVAAVAPDPNAATFCTTTGVNIVRFDYQATQTWDAATRLCPSGSTQTSVTRFGITFNSRWSWYGDVGIPDSNKQDVWSIAAHEFGHANGFDGSSTWGHFATSDTSTCQTKLNWSTMCDGGGEIDTILRTPEWHDIEVFAAAYGGTNSTCGFVVYGGMRTTYDGTGGQGGVLGCPTSYEVDVTSNSDRFPDGRKQTFANGSMYWTAPVGSREVHGAILGRYVGLGEVNYGYPTTNESGTPDGTGRFNHFREFAEAAGCAGANRSIYHHPSTGTYEVHGPIRERWCALKWEVGVGYPVTDQSATPDGRGQYNHFRLLAEPANNCGQNANQSIYWTADTGAHQVRGTIRQKWCDLGWENSVVGYPTTDELGTPDDVGRFNHFRKLSGAGAPYDGSIYFTPSLGAHEVHGPIRDKWAALGWEGNPDLGYPITDQLAVSNGAYSKFQYGHVYWSTDSSAHAVYGPILGYYLGNGWVGKYGFPYSDVYTPTGAPGDRQVDFQLYSLRFRASTGRVEECLVRCV